MWPRMRSTRKTKKWDSPWGARVPFRFWTMTTPMTPTIRPHQIRYSLSLTLIFPIKERFRGSRSKCSIGRWKDQKGSLRLGISLPTTKSSKIVAAHMMLRIRKVQLRWNSNKNYRPITLREVEMTEWFQEIVASVQCWALRIDRPRAVVY